MLPLLIGIVLAAAVGAFAHVVGLDRGRAFYSTVLIVVASYYVLFAVMGGGGGDVIVELLIFAVFAALAVMGFRMSMWVVAAGLALHGIFDFVRGGVLAGRGVPDWWPAFCGGYDAVAAVALAVLLVMERRASSPRSP